MAEVTAQNDLSVFTCLPKALHPSLKKKGGRGNLQGKQNTVANLFERQESQYHFV